MIDYRLSLRYGLCSIVVYACDDVMGEHLEKAAQRIPSWVQTRAQSAGYVLTIVPSHGDGIADPKWRAVSEAWAQARLGLQDPQARSLDAWRALHRFGTLVDRRVFLFQDKSRDRDNFFCLIPTDTLRRSQDPATWIVQAVKTLAVHWYASRGGGALHASGVERHGHGYLFLGPSGAGKSTAAGLSRRVQGAVVHDDQVMVGFQSGRYLLAYPDSDVTPALRAVFLLRQSGTDRVEPLAPGAVCAGLTRSLLEYAVGQDVFGPWVRRTFHNVAAIARSVPGYELYFRKSPDFWNVIDAALGD